MAVNTQKVAVGGLAAGVTLLVLGYPVYFMWLGPRLTAEMDALLPGVSAKMMTGTTNMVISFGGQFVIGLLLAFLYAAMRPRFGAGMKTAVYAALVVWIAGLVFYAPSLQMGTMSTTSYMMASCAALVLNVVAAAVAGMLYAEAA
jgi:hypothetical protein